MQKEKAQSGILYGIGVGPGEPELLTHKAVQPKETWAAITWMGYLLYIHLRLFRRTGRKTLYALLIVSFLALQMCWYGVNYLPAAQQSVHLYNRNN